MSRFYNIANTIKNLAINCSNPFDEIKCRSLAKKEPIGNFKYIYHYHIRKTGGTSLNHILLGSEGEEINSVYKRLLDSKNHRTISNQKVFVGWNKYLIERGNYHYAF